MLLSATAQGQATEHTPAPTPRPAQVWMEAGEDWNAVQAASRAVELRPDWAGAAGGCLRGCRRRWGSSLLQLLCRSRLHPLPAAPHVLCCCSCTFCYRGPPDAVASAVQPGRARAVAGVVRASAAAAARPPGSHSRGHGAADDGAAAAGKRRRRGGAAASACGDRGAQGRRRRRRRSPTVAHVCSPASCVPVSGHCCSFVTDRERSRKIRHIAEDRGTGIVGWLGEQ